MQKALKNRDKRNKAGIALLLVCTVAGVPSPLALADNQPAALLSQPAATPTVAVDSAAHLPAKTDEAQSLRPTSLGFLQPQTLTPSVVPPESQTAVGAKTVIHFLAGIDVNQMAKPLNEQEAFKNV